MAETGLELRSKVTSGGELELSLESVEVPTPGADEVLIRMEAAPINPSDLGLLLGPADISTARASGTAERPVLSAKIPEKFMKSVEVRIDKSMAVGNEGAGVVIAAGDSDAAQALMGKTVAGIGGAMYTQYRVLRVHQCLPLGKDTTPAEGASCFVNPLTALGMVETMRAEGHTALVHTAAASNLGQMLVKICIADGVDLVNIVRRAEHVELLRKIGAKYVVDSSLPSFSEDLTAALAATGATLAFDATGGGRLASQILSSMEAALSANLTEDDRYGSTTHKQVYIYGGLERSRTELDRDFGMAWGIGGWLLTPFLQKAGIKKMTELQTRVAKEIKTTFASTYTKEVSLAEALHPDSVAVYGKQATGEKYLINPSKGL